jgi:hypothetical protein
MMAIGVKGRDPKITWEIIGIYRATNEDLRLFENWQTGWIFGKNYVT